MPTYRIYAKRSSGISSTESISSDYIHKTQKISQNQNWNFFRQENYDWHFPKEKKYGFDLLRGIAFALKTLRCLSGSQLVIWRHFSARESEQCTQLKLEIALSFRWGQSLHADDADDDDDDEDYDDDDNDITSE